MQHRFLGHYWLISDFGLIWQLSLAPKRVELIYSRVSHQHITKLVAYLGYALVEFGLLGKCWILPNTLFRLVFKGLHSGSNFSWPP
jgi:hypothetical protein